MWCGTAPNQLLTHTGRPVQKHAKHVQALRDFIDELYASKQQSDARCQEAGSPRETMAEHLVTFLNLRFGLRDLVHSWLAGIRAAVQDHAESEHDVSLFAKVLLPPVTDYCALPNSPITLWFV